MAAIDPPTLLLDAFRAGLTAADPLVVVPPHLPAPPRSGKTIVVGAGKAAAAMARAVEDHWPGDSPLEGLVVTRYRHALPTRRIEVVEAGHPLPDVQGLGAARRILQLAGSATPDDLLLCLISGGGSSLLTMPAADLTMEDLRDVTGRLLRSGADIAEINTVRKHLSAILGGRLAAASGAPVLTLAISDVTGDDASVIASGPCAPDATTYENALAVLARHGIGRPASVLEHLQRGARGEVDETPKPGAAVFRRVENRVIATGRGTLVAAAKFLESKGIGAVVLGDSVTGEARTVAGVYAALVREIRASGEPWTPPVALLSGGETTITVKGNGRGGRNAEFALALALHLKGMDAVHAIACDTDGIDGTEDNAGALVAPDSLRRALALGLDVDAYLENNDSYSLFAALGDLIVTGPTRTNVNDFRAILVL